MYFDQLAEVIGQDVIGREKGMSDDERRVLGLFMLSSWHGEEPLEPGDIVQNRAHATKRKQRERDYMSPDDNAQHLCNFTALARGMSAALQKDFTAEEFKSVVKEFDSKEGKHKGVCGLNEDNLRTLLDSKGVTIQRFTAAMFSNVLTPERFDVLQADLAETRRRVKAKKALDEDASGEAPPKPEAKPKAPAAAPTTATAAAAADPVPGGFLASLLGPGLSATRSAELVADTPAFVEAVNVIRSHPEIYVQAAHEELSLMMDPSAPVVSQPDGALAAVGSFSGLAAMPSWDALAASPSVGGLVSTLSAGGLGATPSFGLGPTLSFGAAASLGAAPSLGALPSTLALQGMILAHSDPDPGAALQSQSAAELAPLAKAQYQGLGPTLSADGGAWLPANPSGANQEGLCTASGLFATVALARASDLSRSSGSGGTQALLLPEGASRRIAQRCVASRCSHIRFACRKRSVAAPRRGDGGAYAPARLQRGRSGDVPCRLRHRPGSAGARVERDRCDGQRRVGQDVRPFHHRFDWQTEAALRSAVPYIQRNTYDHRSAHEATSVWAKFDRLPTPRCRPARL